MIKNKELCDLYNWSCETKFPLYEEPTSYGHPTKPILYYPLKLTRKRTIIKENFIKNKNIIKIFNNTDILFSAYVVIQSKTEHGPHKDLNVYSEEFKRIQIPIKVPNQEDCYMIWDGEKVVWEEGKYQIYEVMDYIHEGYNYSDNSLEFLFLDVKKDTEIQ